MLYFVDNISEQNIKDKYYKVESEKNIFFYGEKRKEINNLIDDAVIID
jgi:hypothetical protein